ncbi:MAG: PTS sugar transporter subunit IIA [Planctomycetota bacterium]|jgi:mannitol/fructose-specific phosphotransferase system IIA component (Ntr-type)
MNITDILSPEAVKVPLASTTKKAVIDELVDLLDEAGLVEEPDTLKQVVWEREQQRSTGIGDGLAIPHGKSTCAKDLVMAIGRPGEPIDFESLDGRADHIQALGKISRMMSDQRIREAAYGATSAEALYRLFKEAEKPVPT